MKTKARIDPDKYHLLHCPTCWRWSNHTRTVHNGHEFFQCRTCGHIQSYKLPEAVSA